MTDFLSTLALLFCLMFSGVVSWLLLPIIVIIRLLLSGGYNREAWGKLLSDLFAIAVLSSLTAQLVLDYRSQLGSFANFAPWIAALFLFVFVLEASIDKRLEIINENRKWTSYPEYSPEIRFWRVPPIVVLPLFLVFMIWPAVNIPYAYTAFRAAAGWLFNLPYIGLVLKWAAVILGARFSIGCLYFLFLRIVRALSPSLEADDVPESGMQMESESERISENRTTYREAVSKVIETENTLLAACRQEFGEGYGPSGLLICTYADIIAKATIENSRSRSERELPSSPEEIKKAIIEVTELSIIKQKDISSLDPLKMAYTLLARFLPESKARLVIERNQGWFSENPTKPGLQSLEEAEQIEAEVDAEEERLEEEFDQIIIELLENKKVKAERELAAILLELSSDDPDLVVEELLDEFSRSDIKEGTSQRYSGDALIAWRRGDHKTALHLFTKCIELDLNDGAAFLNRGNLQIEMGHFEAGISDLEKARDIDPELPWQNALIFKMLDPKGREATR